jgi:serine/threonine protein kinase
MAPEQVFTRTYGSPVDVFAYGIVLFELLTGEIPYDKKSQPEIYGMLERGERPEIPSELMEEPIADLIGQCWASDPEHRPTFDQICEIFENELALFPGTRTRGLRQLLRFIESHEHAHDFVPRADLVGQKKQMKHAPDGDAIGEAASFGKVRQFTEFVTISKQINVNVLDRKKNAPLHRAVMCGEDRMVSFLVQIRDIDVNVKSRKGSTPLMIAVRGGNVKLVEKLLKNERIDVNVRDDDKNTALHLAVESGSVVMVQCLVERRDVQLDQKGKHKVTPLKLAQSKKFGEIEAVLTEAIGQKKK